VGKLSMFCPYFVDVEPEKAAKAFPQVLALAKGVLVPGGTFLIRSETKLFLEQVKNIATLHGYHITWKKTLTAKDTKAIGQSSYMAYLATGDHFPRLEGEAGFPADKETREGLRQRATGYRSIAAHGPLPIFGIELTLPRPRKRK
jgi:hypothetical protein